MSIFHPAENVGKQGEPLRTVLSIHLPGSGGERPLKENMKMGEERHSQNSVNPATHSLGVINSISGQCYACLFHRIILKKL